MSEQQATPPIVIEQADSPTGPKPPIFLAVTWSDAFKRWAFNTFYDKREADIWIKDGRQGSVYRIQINQ